MVKRHKNRFGVKIIIALLRPLYYHKVVGKENLRGLEDGTMVLVCNHGELYGPVVANLYIPVAFRPWAIAEMMNREVIIEHMYQGTDDAAEMAARKLEAAPAAHDYAAASVGV